MTWLLLFVSLIIGFLCQRQANGTSGQRARSQCSACSFRFLAAFTALLYWEASPLGNWGDRGLNRQELLVARTETRLQPLCRRSKPTGRPRFPCATPNRVRINLPMFFGFSLLFPFCLLLFISGFWSTRFDQPGALPAAPKQTLLLTRRPRGHAWERSKDVGY